MDEFKARYYPIQEHMRVQRLTWMVERVGWVILGAIALLALSGFFGTGPLSTRTMSAGGLTVEYERFERKTKMTEFDFHFAAGEAGERKLHLNEPFRNAYEISGVQPQPVRAEADAGGMTLTFAMPSDGGAVKLWAHPRRFGSLDLEARAGDGPPLAFNVFIYP